MHVNKLYVTLCFTQKAEVFPPWTSRLEWMLQGWTPCQSQVQTFRGEQRQVQTCKREMSALTSIKDMFSSRSVPFQKYLLSQGTEHRQFFNLLERLLEYEPSKRITLSSALHHPFFLSPHPPGGSQVWRNSCDMSS